MAGSIAVFPGEGIMNVVTIVLIVLVILACSGSFAGWYPHSYGFGGGGLILIILLLLLLMGRL